MFNLFKFEFNFTERKVELKPTRRGFLIHLAIRGMQAKDLAGKLL